MTNSTDTVWTVDGVSLQTFAWNITTLGGDRMAVPPLRGENVTVPGRPGDVWMPKIADSRTISLGMWVIGANEDGSIPREGDVGYRWLGEKNNSKSRMDRRGGDPVINEFENPSFEYVRPGSTVIRRNLVPNPDLKTMDTYGSTRVTPEVAVEEGVSYFRGTVTEATAASGARWSFTLGYMPEITAGATYTFSVEARGWLGAQVAILFYDSGSSYISGSVTYSAPFGRGEDWVRGGVTATAPPGAKYAMIYMGNGYTARVGDVIQIRRPLLEQSENIGEFFSGDSIDIDGFVYEWEGSPSASSSVVKAYASVVFENMFSNPSMETAGAETVVRENLALNSSFELAQAGTDVVRRNYSLNPRAIIGVVGWNANSPDWTITKEFAISGHPNGITTAAKSELASPGSSASIASMYSCDGLPSSQSDSRMMGLWVYVSTSFTDYEARVGNVGTATAVPPKTWTWVTASQPMAAPYPGIVSISRTGGNAGTADYALLTGSTVQYGSSPKYFFDGSRAPENGFTYAWEGTVNASRSVAKSGATTVRENLVTNPKFKKVSSTYDMWTNLATNPSFETPSGEVVVRENLILDPDFTATTLFAPTGSTVSIVNGRLQSVAINAGTTGTRQGFTHTVPTAYPAGTYTLSIDLESTSANHTDVRIYLYNTVSAVIQATGYMGFQANTGSKRYAVTMTASGPFDRVYVEFIGTTITDGDTGWFDKILLESGSVAGTFFSGSSVAAGDFTYRWAGTAGESISQEVAVGVAGAYIASVSGVVFHSGSVPFGGSKFARYRLTTDNALNAATADFEPVNGTTYTIKLRARAVTRDQVVYTRIGGRYDSSKPITLPKGVWTEVVGTHVASSSGGVSTGLLILNASGHKFGDLIDIDEHIIVEGEYTGPYFNGSSADTTDLTYEWAGVVNASASKAVARMVAGTNNFVSQMKTQQITDSSARGGFFWRSVSVISTDKGINLSGESLKPSTDYTMVIRAKASKATSGWQVRIGGVSGSALALTTSWKEFKVSVKTGTSLFYSGLINVAGDFPAGEYVDIDYMMIVEGTFDGVASPTYFDGDSSLVGDYGYKWSGVQDASTSLMYGAAPALNSSPSSVVRAVLSYDWSKSGKLSLRQTPVYSIRGSGYSEIATWTGSTSSDPLVRGKTYTILATCRKTQNSTGYQAGYITFIGTTAVSSYAPEAAGVYGLRLTFTVPETGNWYLRLYNGGKISDPDIWWDDILIVEGAYSGSHWDGNTPAGQDVVYRWGADPYTSISQQIADSVKYGTSSVTPVSYSLVQAYQSSEWASRGTQSLRLISKADGGSISVAAYLTNVDLGLTPGTYTAIAKVRIKSPQAAPNEYSHTLVFYENALNAITVSNQPPNVAGVYELRVTFTYTSGIATLRFVHGGVASDPDVWFDEVLLVRGEYSGEYFDGDSADYGDYSVVWSGVPHDSHSTVATVAPNGITAANCTAILSSEWSASGTGKSLKLTRPTHPAASRAIVNSSSLLYPGKTYTVIGTMHLDAPLRTPLGSYFGKIMYVQYGGSHPGVYASEAVIPNTAGDHLVRWTFTIEDNADSVQLALGYGGTDTAGETPGAVYWDNFAIIEGEYNGPYFDGGLEGSFGPIGQFEANWRMLRKLLWKPRRQLELTKKFYDQGSLITATAKAQFVNGLEPTMTGKGRAVFVADLNLADPYFYGDPVTVTLTDGVNVLDLVGDDYTMAIQVTIKGARDTVKIDNTTLGISMTYGTALAAGERADIDVAAFKAMHTPSTGLPYKSSGYMSHVGDPYWMVLAPGYNELSLLSTSGTGEVTLTYRPVWL